MSTRFSKSLFGVLAGVGLLTACHGTGNYPPSASAPSSQSMAAHGTPTHLPYCEASEAKVPGTYIVMDSQGNAKNGTYSTTNGIWAELSVTPTSAPSAVPTSEPSVPADNIYAYVGTYSLAKHQQTGCAYLVVSANGQALVGDDNETLTAVPNFSSVSYALEQKNHGRLSAKVSGLSRSGGKGTLTLESAGGGTYDTGTLTFTRRIGKHEILAGSAIPSAAFDPFAPRENPHYAFTCDPSKFQNRYLHERPAGVKEKLGNFVGSPNASYYNYWYRVHFSFCGVDNSNIDAQVVTSEVRYDNGNGRAGYYLDATFDSAYPWSGKPYVAVWEAAWWLNIFPASNFNEDFMLVHVLPK